MTKKNLIQQFKERDLIVNLTDEKALTKRLEQKKNIVVYCGFDPTADSLHVGHLVPLLCLKRFQNAGHKPIVLIGGATGLIGDPSFKKTERKLNTLEVVNNWGQKIYNQVKNFLKFNCDDKGALIINNYDWFHNMNILTFLRDIGKNFSINNMINRESVKKRLNREEYGISFTEFSYNLLQSYDFAELNKRYGVELQIGGSDQWGNITSGIDLTRRLYQNHVWGLTVPLITNASGTKFGKTEGNSIWLDSKKTSPYKFYQFWINTEDANVYSFLKFFTFISIDEIRQLEKKDKNIDKIPYSKYVLAEQVTRLVHGESGLIAAQRITKSLFSGTFNDITESDFEQLAQDGLPVIVLNKTTDLQQALVTSKLVSSRSQARNMINAKAITINDKKQFNINYYFDNQDRIFGRFTLLKRGKKHYCLINWKLK